MSISKEKDYYKRFLEQTKGYYEYDYILWAENLFTSKIVVYPKKLSDAYDSKKVTLENVGLVVVYPQCHPPIKIIAANADVVNEIIYITENSFNAIWGNWKPSLNDAIKQARYGRKYCPASKPEDLIILDYLKRDGSYPEITQKGIEYFEKPKPMYAIQGAAKKQRLLDNPRLVCFYDSQNSILHDKECMYVPKIPADRFCGSDHIPANTRLCGYCKKKLLLRIGCSPYVSHIPSVAEFFRNMGLPDSYLEKFVVEKGLRFKMVSPNELEVTGKEDTWRIVGRFQSELTLYHNNYKRNDDNTRTMLGGFHCQGFRGHKISRMLFFISDYSWEGHLENEKTKRRKNWLKSLFTGIGDFVSDSASNTANRLKVWYNKLSEKEVRTEPKPAVMEEPEDYVKDEVTKAITEAISDYIDGKEPKVSSLSSDIKTMKRRLEKYCGFNRLDYEKIASLPLAANRSMLVYHTAGTNPEEIVMTVKMEPDGHISFADGDCIDEYRL